MKSTDKFVLVLVASLALLLAGCGGGSTSNTGDDMDDMDMSMEQKTTLMNAHTVLQQAVNALVGEATLDEVGKAKIAAEALKRAIDGATDVAPADLTVYQRALTSANTAIGVAEGLLTKAANMDMAKVGKALKAALGSTPLGALDRTVNPGGVSFGTTGLTVNTISSTDTDPVLSAGDSAGTLGDWKGTNYAVTNPGTKAVDSAVVYGNQAAPTVKPFAEGATLGTAALTSGSPTTAGNYDSTKRLLTLGSGVSTTDIKGVAPPTGYNEFPTAGSTTYPDSDTAGVKIRGTYQGAPGLYTCTTATCTAAVAAGGAISLTAGTWHFTHDSGAMTSKPDPDYLVFGWWLNKDKDGEPTAASAFFGTVGVAPTVLTGVNAIVGSATYAGKAAGKFALSNPLDSTGDGGHFTADATLTAKFSGTGAGISGMINNFMANDKSVPWSVALNNTATTGGSATTAGTSISNIDAAGTFAAIADNSNTTVNEALSTVWSIDGNSAPASGTWSGQMYDESTTDGSNVPTAVLGVFQSQFGSIGSMVGAFGAEKE